MDFNHPKFMKPTAYHRLLLALVSVVLVWSVVHPHDYLTWLLEVLPALVGGAIVLATYRRFRLTSLVYTLIAIHAIILMIGGHYTYAEVPLFNRLRDAGVFARNDYDKVGHLAQGFVPALITRELLVRTSPLASGKWLTTLAIAVPGAISAAYEIFEWWVSVATGSAGDAFLGTQGYVWDTQSDMLMCFIGAVAALLLLSRWHDAQLRKLRDARHVREGSS
jgi:putative membrane protein